VKPVWENIVLRGGKTHSEETKIQMSEAKKGKNNPLFGKTGKNHPKFGKGKPLSEETKAKMSEAKKGQNHPFFGKTRSEETKAKISAAHGASIEVLDLETNISTNYASLKVAARALNINNHKIISQYISRKQQTPYKGRFIFTKILAGV
jgi:group I intron endonuclease